MLRKTWACLLLALAALCGRPALAFDSGPAAKPDLVAGGERITLKDGDFSIQPPKGWEVFTTLPGLTLMAQIPFQQGMKFQRSIQVLSFEGSRYIDDTTAKEFEETIVRKFSQTSVSIEGFRVRNHMNVELADGRQGWLFYTEYTQEGVSLMQAHILVSSKTRHYLMTYTDVAEHFENDAASQFLTEAWDAMISVELGSRTPSRFAAAGYIGITAGVLVVLSLIFMVFRRWRSAKQYRQYANGKGLEDVSLAEEPLSQVDVRFEDAAPPRSKGASEPPQSGSGIRSRQRSTNIPPPSEHAEEHSGIDEDEPFDTDDDIAV